MTGHGSVWKTNNDYHYWKKFNIFYQLEHLGWGLEVKKKIQEHTFSM